MTGSNKQSPEGKNWEWFTGDVGCRASLAPNWLTARHVEHYKEIHCEREHGSVASRTEHGTCSSSPQRAPHPARASSRQAEPEQEEEIAPNTCEISIQIL